MAKKATIQQLSKFAEDWVPIKNIINGMIHLENGSFVTGVKIAPKNIFILDQGTQDAIIFNMRNFYNMIDFEFWLIVADRPVDLNLYTANLQIKYNEAADGGIRKLVMQDINKANMFMSAGYGVVDTEYYILFKEKKMDMVQKKVHSLISGLANAQMNSAQVSNADLRMLLDNFFNGGMSTEFRTVMLDES